MGRGQITGRVKGYVIRSLILSTKCWSLEEQKINKNMVYDNFVKKITQQHITSRYRKYEKHKGVMKHILSLPVMPLFWGTADIAIKSESTIVPVAIERYGKKYFVNIGRKIDNHLLTKMDKSILTQILRDEMATLKWEIWERQGKHIRSELGNGRETFLNQIFNEKNTSVTLEDVLKCRYYPK